MSLINTEKLKLENGAEKPVRKVEEVEISPEDFTKETERVENAILNISDNGVVDPVLKNEIKVEKQGALKTIQDLYTRFVDTIKDLPSAKTIGKLAVPAVATIFMASHGEAQTQKVKEPKPIVVNSPNDPRLKAYEDSLYLYNESYKMNQELLEQGLKFKTELKFPEDNGGKSLNKPINFHVFHLYDKNKNDNKKRDSIDSRGVKHTIEESSERKAKYSRWIPTFAKPKNKYTFKSTPIDTSPEGPPLDIPEDTSHKKKIETGGFTTDAPFYPTIKIKHDKKGRPLWYENSNGDRIPYDANNPSPKFTKQFAYPNFGQFRNKKSPEPDNNEPNNPEKIDFYKEYVKNVPEKNKNVNESGTIFVHDKNDPRLEAYNDSLFLSKNSKKVQEFYEKNGYTKKIVSVENDCYQQMENAYKGFLHGLKVNFIPVPLSVARNYETRWYEGTDFIKDNKKYQCTEHYPGKIDVGRRLEEKTLAGDIITYLPRNEYSKILSDYVKKLKPRGRNLVPIGNSVKGDKYFNIDAPIQYIHKNIKPTMAIEYKISHGGLNGQTYGDIEIIYSYDPEKIKPKEVVVYRPEIEETRTAPLQSPSAEKPIPEPVQVPHHKSNGFTTDAPGYSTIQIKHDNQGKPLWYVNSNGEKIPYDANNPSPKFTKEFAYPNLKNSKEKNK